MRRRHWFYGGGFVVVFAAVAVGRLLFGNGVVWHFLPWHL